MKISDSSSHDCSEAVSISRADRDRMIDKAQFYLLSNPGEPYFFSWTGDAFIIGLWLDGNIEIVDAKPLRQKTLYIEQTKSVKKTAPKKKTVTKKATAAKTTKKKR